MRRAKVKQREQERLLELAQNLQLQLQAQQAVERNVIELSDDNQISESILNAKYSFVYQLARELHTKSSSIPTVITQ